MELKYIEKMDSFVPVHIKWPKDPKSTIIRWEEGSAAFSMCHEESQTYMYFMIDEIPELIESLKELKKIVKSKKIVDVSA